MKRLPILLFLCSAASLVHAREYSASANALSGLNILSDSVADHAISPVQGQAGFSTFYHRPFNMSAISIFGLHNAVRKGPLCLAVGNSYLWHQDYTWHNPYLSLGYHSQHLQIGAGGQLIYDAVGNEDGHYKWSFDLAVAGSYEDYGVELKLLNKDQVDECYSLSLSADLTPKISLAGGCFVMPGQENSLRIGVKAPVNQYLSLMGSWQSELSRFGAGISLNVDPWSLTYSVRSHPELCSSHSVSLELYW